MVTGTLEALVDVDLTELTHGSVGTRALEAVHEVVADAVVLAAVGLTIVDVEFAILALESFEALALVGPDEVLASGSVLARRGCAFIDFVLTVAAKVAVGTETLVAVANIPAVASVLAELGHGSEAAEKSGRLARDLSHIAHLACPSWMAVTLEGGSSLLAACSIFTWRISAPVDDLLALSSRPPGRAVASVEAIVRVNTSALVSARILIALGPRELAVGAGEPVGADTGVVVNAVDTSSSVHARAGCAVLVVDLAICTRETTSAFAGVGVDVVFANGTVAAWIGSTLVNVNLAEFTTKSVNAETLESVGLVEASSSIEAGFLGAIVRVDQAVAAFEAISALAFIAAQGVDTLAAVSAGRRDGALVDVLVAEPPLEPEGAGAHVLPEVGGRSASGPVGAVVVHAWVHLGLASLAGEWRLTDAHEVV